MIRLARHYRKQLAHKGKHESVKSHSSGFWLHVSRFSYSYVASLDQSTTSTKFSIFRSDGKLIDKEVLEHRQICPAEGLLQHDPREIMANVNLAIESVLGRLAAHQEFNISELKGLGVCNQRETIVCWDTEGNPLHNAIVWCDTRSKSICEDFKQKYGDFKLLTGLPVSPYFSLFKMLWLLQNVPGIKDKLEKGKVRFGTIDTWIAYNLTGKYVTDASNASRTYLCNLNGEWDDSLLRLANIPRESLPRIVDSFSLVGLIRQGPLKNIPICSILGDQQSSAYAHSLALEEMKITYGTGCFLMSNIGNKPEMHDSFITTILHRHRDSLQYAYEASVECGGGTLNWARRAKWFDSYKELNYLQPSKDELHFLPSFGEVLSPFWKKGGSGGLFGLNYSTSKEHILYSLLQAITFRLYDNIKVKEFAKVQRILADGGMTSNPMFMQMQANTFNKVLEVRQLDTCWGVSKGVFTCLDLPYTEAENVTQRYLPNPEAVEVCAARYKQWCELRTKVYGW